MNLWKKIILTSVFISACIFALPATAQEFSIVTSYCGVHENSFVDANYGLKLNDSQSIYGMFVQTVNPEKYQWNIFLYQTEDINYSDIWGFNLIYDWYFGSDKQNKKVVGVGINYIETDLSGKNVPFHSGQLEGFDLELRVVSPYIRGGKYYNFGQDRLGGRILPWVGMQLDVSRGTGSVDFQGPGAASFEINDNKLSLITGGNIRMNFSHFLQADAKYSVAYSSGDLLDKRSLVMNLFLTRSVALSYRYKYHETPMGSDSNNMLGIAMVF